MADLTEYDRITAALEACARKLDGSAAAPAYFSRRRRVLFNVLRYAVSRKRLTANPLSTDLDWKAPEEEACEEVDPAAVASPAQVRELLTAASYAGWRRGPRLVAFFACMYYAMMRPGEVTALRKQDCDLPESGWGRLMLSDSRPTVGTEWTNDGQTRETRGLKGRPRKAKRPIPIPPELVAHPAFPHRRLRRRGGRQAVPHRTRRRVARVRLLPYLAHSTLAGAEP
ncbi:hypothetical protein ETD86_49005 [Nonomuraea turkmeniaca]|uniref:Tyr recombinase domain-containing protein n=1 Tax=Nonomuraea turkmeniaca TaxID=103838 RepID=A0A5S4EX07_9ACTN|nr:hypothetical protein [Nonomuraea turkmeniaca]TMR08162.1 hypothetical protein ETD86_49005 [Nonomuraea turkmeniaca]